MSSRRIAGYFCLCDNKSVQGEQDAKTSNSFLDPERIVAGFGLKKGDHVADFGAGHGYFTIPLARAVGGDGRVYAIDIQKPTLDIIRAKAGAEHLLNVEYVWADLDVLGGSRLKDKFLDFVLIADILFQAEDKQALAREAYRALASGGRMAMVEWEVGNETIGPSPEARIKKEAGRALALQAGFEYDREFAAGSHHYGLLFVKK